MNRVYGYENKDLKFICNGTFNRNSQIKLREFLKGRNIPGYNANVKVHN